MTLTARNDKVGRMRVRKALERDQADLEALIQRANYLSPALWRWEEYLGDDCFVVIERGKCLVGALFARLEILPTAWVWMAAVDYGLDVEDWLDLALPPVIEVLRARGVQQLIWMDQQGWMGPYLSAWDFDLLTEVVTLVKSDRRVPTVNATGVRLRPALGADVPAVTVVDQAAFTPPWWHSETGMRQWLAEASHVIVVEVAGEVVGYTAGKVRSRQAHLGRIAVHPDCQGRGVGGVLLREMLHTFWQAGAERVSLNTQRDNTRSMRLYQRFGFEPTKNTATVWGLGL